LITRKSDLVIPGPPLRGIFPFRHVDDVDGQIRQLRAEGGAQVIAAAFHEDKIEVAELFAQRFHRGEVHRGIFADRGMRAAAGFDADDAFRRQRARFGENALIFFGVDVVGDHRQLPGVAHGFAQRFQQGGFTGADRAADADAQRVFICSYFS
jgi:hypothetical protein